MEFERFEKLKLIELCEIGIRAYKNMATEALTPDFKIEMLHEVDFCEALKEEIEGEL